MKVPGILLVLFAAVFGLGAPLAAAEPGPVVAQVDFTGGLPRPGGPFSSGIAVYSDGSVATFQNYADRTVTTVSTYLTNQQLSRLAAAGAPLESVALVRDPDSPQCADAPYVQYSLLNAQGRLVPIRDSLDCVEGNRPDGAGYAEAAFLQDLVSVAQYGG